MDVEWFTNIMKRVEESYINGMPLHIARPEESIFQVMDNDKFQELQDTEVQAIWGKKHMVITGLDKPFYGFDTEGLMTITFPSRVFPIQGPVHVLA
jgi:hypothetical protein